MDSSIRLKFTTGKYLSLKKKKIGYIILIIIGVIAILGFALSSPIAQDEAYHNFSDTLTIGGIPNFWNVVSNFPFLMVGLYGLFQIRRINKVNLQFLAFYIGISFVSIGSAYYHYSPTTNTLVWDRLPMTIVFTAFISIVISELINDKKGKVLLFPLVALGIVSILYWVFTGDLRIYALVQFYPILAIPVILVLFKTERNSTTGYWLLLVFYLVAKLFEMYDFEIQNHLKFMSGHSLKHVAASVGIYFFAKSWKAIPDK